MRNEKENNLSFKESCREYVYYQGVIRHKMYKDSFSEGEGDFFDSWTYILKGDTIKELLKKTNSFSPYISPHLLDWEKESTFESDYGTGDLLVSSILTTKHQTIPSDEEYERWQRGEIELYINNIWLKIFAVSPCDDIKVALTYKNIVDGYNGTLDVDKLFTSSVELSDEEYDEGFDEKVIKHKRRLYY